jgi:hypothetical protein
MATVLGIWIGLAGVLPALAGISGLRRVRRLRRHGVQAWAVATPLPPADGQGLALRYTLPDGRALEKITGARSAAVLPGERVLLWYDPADPMDVLIQGRRGRASDLAFLLTGAAFAVAGALIGILAP